MTEYLDKEKAVLLRDIRSVSSGTLATLTGLKNLSAIEKLQQDWVAFINTNPSGFNYRGWTWGTAWRAFSLYAKRAKKQRGENEI